MRSRREELELWIAARTLNARSQHADRNTIPFLPTAPLMHSSLHHGRHSNAMPLTRSSPTSTSLAPPHSEWHCKRQHECGTLSEAQRTVLPSSGIPARAFPSRPTLRTFKARCEVQALLPNSRELRADFKSRVKAKSLGQFTTRTATCE